MIKEEVKEGILVSLAKNEKVKDIAEKFEVSTSTVYRMRKNSVKKINEIETSIKILLLKKDRKYLEALEISDMEEWQNSEVIQSQKKKILEAWQNNSDKKIAESVGSNTLFDNKTRASKEFVDMGYLDKIKNNAISLDEINVLKVSEPIRDILVVAFYEVNNYHVDIILNYLRKLRVKYDSSKELLGVIRSLMERVKTKRRYFDINFYGKLLKKVKDANFTINSEREALLTLKENLNNLRPAKGKGR